MAVPNMPYQSRTSMHISGTSTHTTGTNRAEVQLLSQYWRGTLRSQTKPYTETHPIGTIGTKKCGFWYLISQIRASRNHGSAAQYSAAPRDHSRDHSRDHKCLFSRDHKWEGPGYLPHAFQPLFIPLRPRSHVKQPSRSLSPGSTTRVSQYRTSHSACVAPYRG
eukprot:2207009-Rhodomonas_salina.1